MKKRIIATLVTLVLTISLFPTMSVFAAKNDEIQLLQDLGIVERLESTGLKAASYTRSRFARSLMMMTNSYADKGAGIEGAAGGGDIYTSSIDGKVEVTKVDDGTVEEDPTLAYAADITEDTNSPSIMRAIEHGYMETDAAGNFRPTDPVTKMEATRALIRALNYDEAAEENGGTDAAYLNIAARLGLFRRVTVQNEQNLTVDEIAGMIANAMSIQIHYDENVNLEDICFYDVWALTKHSGKLLANSSLGLAVEKTRANYVNIGGKLFHTDILIPNELVGCQVTFYTRTTSIDETIVSVCAQGDSETVTLKPGQIEKVSQSGNVITVTYDTDETVKITTRGYALVNGKTVSPSKALLDALDCGTVTFVDSDGDGIYDIMHMDMLETIAISGVATDQSKIVAKYRVADVDGDNTINLKNYDLVEVYLNNKSATVADLKKDMIVDVACDAFSIVDGKIQSDFAGSRSIKIYGKTRVANGCVVSITDNKVYIDDMDYEFGELYHKLVADGILQEIKLGDYVDAQFDSMNRLAYYEVDTTQGKVYGYLIGTGQLNQGLTSVLEFRIMTAEGEIKTFPAADKFILDGTSVEKKNVVLSDGNINLRKRQVVRYRTSDDGVLRELDTTYVSTAESEANSLTKEGLLQEPYGTGESKLKAERGVINKQYSFADGCIAFLDSAPLVEGVLPNERLIQCVNISTLTTGSIERYIAGYDANPMKELSCIAIYDAYGLDSAGEQVGLDYWTYNAYVVDSIARSVDTEGAPSWEVKLVGCNSGETKCTVLSSMTRLYVTPDNDWQEHGIRVEEKDVNSFESLVGPGDVVRFSTNFLGQVDRFERDFDFSAYGGAEDAPIVQGGTSEAGEDCGGDTFAFANVEAAYDNGLVVYSYNDPTAPRIFKAKKDKFPKAVLYNAAKGEASYVEYADLPSSLTGQKTKAFIRYYSRVELQDYIFYVYE